MALLLQHLSVGYRNKPILSDVNLAIPHGQVTMLIGPNGSGKSTLLRTIAGMQPPLAGEVLVSDKAVSRLSVRERAALIAVVLTDREGGGGLTVFEAVSIGRHPYSGAFGHLSPRDREIVNKSIADVGLTHKSGEYLARLSDGERQKAMIARAIAQDTPVIVLDEPTNFLDVAARYDIMALLGKVAADKTILLSTHDIAAAASVAHSVYSIKDGKVSQGFAPDIFPGVEYIQSVGDFRPL